MRKSKAKIAGWILSALISAFLIFSANGKFQDWEGKEKMLTEMGWELDLMAKVGWVELAVALLFLIPRAGFIGAILLTAYLGGATATHVRLGDPFFFPVILGALVWTALALRDPSVFRAIVSLHKPNLPTVS
ncbi:MAG: DoxX family protein [Puniceicoccales bacterium]